MLPRSNQRYCKLFLHKLPQGLHANCVSLRHNHLTCVSQWGLVNFDASTLWVRDRRYLTDALDVTPPFLRTTHGDAGLSSSTDVCVKLIIPNPKELS